MLRRAGLVLSGLSRRHVIAGAFMIMGITLGLWLHSASALTATLLPTATENNAWSAGTAGCTTATTGHTCVDEGVSANTTDYVATGTSLGSGVSTTFQMADQSNVGTATNIIVYYYAKSVALNGNTPNADTITMELSVGGTPVGTASVQSMTIGFSWYSAQYSGNWTQAQVDDMKVKLTRTVVGGGNQNNADDNVQVSSVYVSMTYTSPVDISQVAYRWFGAEKTRPSGVYGSATTYGTGTTPQGVVVDDFNNDQTLDIATANVGTDNVSVLIGNGNGTFATKVDYAGDDGPTKIISTDLNNDQDKDLVAVNVNSASISVFIGNGDGTFAGKVDYAAQTANNSIAAGDINNDGFIDIVTSGGVLNTYSIFTGNGDGTLDSAVNSSGNGFRGMVITDVNNDQNQDLLFANVTTDSVSVLLGNGNGTFATQVDYAAEDGSASIAVADFNNDQKLDVVLGSQTTTNVSVLFGNGDGTFAAKVVYPAQNGVTSLVTADVNGDEHIDIVTFADITSTGMRVVRNNGDGTFATANFYATSGFAAFGAIDDVNEDGAPDAVAVTKNNNAVSVLLNGFNYPALSAVNTGAVVPASASNFRLRINLGVTGADLSTGSQFKLRYQQKSGTCSTSPAAYADISTTTPIRYYDDPTLTDKSAYVPTDLDPTRSGVLLSYQTYNESNTFGSTSAVFNGRDGLWDLSLAVEPGATPGTTYCLLATKSDGTALNNYSVIPEITVPSPALEQSSYRFYQNADSATPGAPLAAQNIKPTLPVQSSFRLRQLLRQTNDTSPIGESFKLQAGEKVTSCSAASYTTLSDNTDGTPYSTGFQETAAWISGLNDSSGTWFNPEDAQTNDGEVTNFFFNGRPVASAPIIASEFGFSIPSEATIRGIEFRYEVTSSTEVGEQDIYLVKQGTTSVGTDAASLIMFTDNTAYTKGSPTSLWGTTWTPAEINNIDFGVKFAAWVWADGSEPPAISIDYMSLNVHYTIGTSFSSFADNPGVPDGLAIAANATDPTPVSGVVIPQNYSDNETFATRTSLQNGQSGLWDFALRSDPSWAGKTYCFRVVNGDESPLANYAQYPEVTFTTAGPTLSQQLRGGQSVVNGVKRPFNW